MKESNFVYNNGYHPDPEGHTDESVFDGITIEPDYYFESDVILLIHEKGFTSYYELEKYILGQGGTSHISNETLLYMVMEYPDTLRLAFEGVEKVNNKKG